MSIIGARGLELTDGAFRRRLVSLASELGLNADALAVVMSFESAGTFDPKIRNPQSGAVGLIQFLPSTARKLGTSSDALAELTAAEQLEWVGLYYRKVMWRPIVTLADHYLAVFSPKFIGEPLDATMYTAGTPAYEQNKGLDADGDGTITVGEVASTIQGVWDAAERRRRVPVPPPIGVGIIAGTVVVAGALGAAWLLS